MSGATGALVVLLGGREAGVLEHVDGKMRFTYPDSADGAVRRLSLSMPPAEGRVWGPKIAEPWFRGLLPDDEKVREHWGRVADVNGRNPFALLRHYGADAAGAVQVCPAGDVADVTGRSEVWEELDEAAIGARLRAEIADPTAWPSERWSLPGAQAKMALARTRDGWAVPSGAAPSTHIIKPGIPDYPDQALGEHLAMTAARALGHRTAVTEHREFDGVPAIVVERYDRFSGPDLRIRRVHQEDLCQAMGVLPEFKYQADGGPTAVDIVEFLRGNLSAADVERFSRAVILMMLMGAPDAHAKNFSVLLPEHGGGVLAPLYDVASTYPYLATHPSAPRTVAMPIGKVSRFGEMAPRHLERYAAAAGLDPEWVVADARDQAARLPDALADVAAQTGGAAARQVAGAIAAGVVEYVWGALGVQSLP